MPKMQKIWLILFALVCTHTAKSNERNEHETQHYASPLLVTFRGGSVTGTSAQTYLRDNNNSQDNSMMHPKPVPGMVLYSKAAAAPACASVLQYTIRPFNYTYFVCTYSLSSTIFPKSRQHQGTSFFCQMRLFRTPKVLQKRPFPGADDTFFFFNCCYFASCQQNTCKSCSRICAFRGFRTTIPTPAFTSSGYVGASIYIFFTSSVN